MAQKTTEHSFSDSEFWSKVTKVPQESGCMVIRSAISLWVLLFESDTVSVPVKASICACLIYFISPLDFCPDFLPGGYLDDLACMTALLATLKCHFSPKIRQRVEDLLPDRCKGRLVEPTYGKEDI